MQNNTFIQLGIIILLVNMYSCASTSNNSSKENLVLVAMQAKVDGSSLSKNVIRRVVMTRADDYRKCYEKELASKKNQNDEIEVKIMISSRGRVLMAGINSTTMNNPSVESCIVTHIKQLRFPAPKNGKTVKVYYPFRFKYMIGT